MGGPTMRVVHMRKTGANQHFFVVRGRGFDLKQWTRILAVVRDLVERSKEFGLQIKMEGDDGELVLSTPGQESLVIIRKGEPNLPKEITTTGKYDAVVQSVLTAIKKIAPDILEIMSPDGRDYRRLLASTSDGDGAWSRMKKLDRMPKTKEEAFLRAMARQKWRNPETGNMVEFISLPKKEQTELRQKWDKEFGDKYEQALNKAKKEYEEAHKEVQDAGKALTEVQREQQKAERARGLEQAYNKTLQKMSTRQQEQVEKIMNDELLRKAAIRVAHETADAALRKEILTILEPTLKNANCGCGDNEPEESSEESVDVETWLRDQGHKEAADEWSKYESTKDGIKKATTNRGLPTIFPEIHNLAWNHVLSFSKENPNSKVASGSTAERMAAARRLATQWVQDAIKRPGRVRKYLGIPEGETIPMEKLNKAIEKLKGSGNKSLLSALLLAKRLKGMSKKKKKASPDQEWLNEESFSREAAAIWGNEHLGAQWIQDAIKHPGRVRKYLGVPEGETIPMAKLNKAIEKLKGSGNKSLLSALLLAKRLKKMHNK